MKNGTLLFIMAAGTFFSPCFSQRKNPMDAKLGNAIAMADRTDKSNLSVAFYHVEERVNLMVGSRITTYNVSDISLVDTNDLGPNNTRVITPKYAKGKATAISGENLKTTATGMKLITATAAQPTMRQENKEKTVAIDVVSTYERVLDKGYKSVDMLKKVADRHYFDGDLAGAAKWYAQLVELTTDLDALYYYRYSKSLMAINQTEKANEMMKVFENKNL